MDRRHFFKIVLLPPMLSPFLVSFKSTKNASHLYLITEFPQKYITSILHELNNYGLIHGHRFSFLTSFPFDEDFKRTLTQRGWNYIPSPSQIDLSFSFINLHQKVDPSFTLVRQGTIWDLRSKKLASLWLKMRRNDRPSSLLTIASFKNNPSSQSGKAVSVYKDGRKIGHLSLKKNSLISYNTEKGPISVRVKDGKAWVQESSCPQKICCFSPPISLAAERIICAPNHFLLEIEGSSFVDTIIG